MLRALSTAGFVLAISVSVLPSQQLQEGLQTQTTMLPPGSGQLLATPTGLVYFDGQDLQFAAPAQPAQSRLHFPGFRFGSFTIDAGNGHVLFGESSQHELWLVSLAGPLPTAPLTTVMWNYDAALLSPQRAVVSARLGGFAAPDNELIAVDLVTGQQQVFASIPGASGPVEVAANGDLYYATGSPSFPTPPGTARIVRFRAAVVANALQQQSVLTLAQAEAVAAGLDSVADLAFDDDGDLHFTDWFNTRIGEVDDADGPAARVGAGVANYSASFLSPASLQFVRTTGMGVFEPFQPQGGGLLVLETDYFSQSQMRTVRSSEAQLVATAPNPIQTGAFALIVVNGPSNGIGVVAIAGSTTPGIVPIAMPGFEQPLLWSPALLSPLLALLPLDAMGNGSLQIQNPGFAPILAATAQAAMVSATGVLGATPPIALLLTQ